MYNRYIRNDQGVYTRIPEEEPSRQRDAGAPHSPEPPPVNDNSQAPPSRESRQEESRQQEPQWEAPRSGGPGPPPRRDPADIISRTLRQVLDRFHLEQVDTGDLLLLLVLFLLFEEDADEELLFALGLLLIL